MEETKIIYYVDDEETPYLIRFQTPPDQLTLGDFKNALNRPNYKFFFKSLDDDFGVVKEEISEEDARLPCVNGRVVSWLVAAEGSTHSDNQSSSGKEAISSVDIESKDRSDSSDPKSPQYRHGNKGLRRSSRSDESKQIQKVEVLKTRHKFFGPEKINVDETDDTFDEIDSIYNGDKVPPLRRFNDYKHGTKLKKVRAAPAIANNSVVNLGSNSTTSTATKQVPIYESSSSMMSSDLETTSFFDSEDESSRFSSCTETTMSSKYGRQKRQMRRRRKMPHLSHASSFSSMTDSTVSLNIITVTLNMDTVPFLGISIVGQTNGNGDNGDGGIYVGSIMKGGAVALDGRIEPGDMILEVNGISFENVSNEEAVRTLREQVQKPGPVTLVVAKSWDPNPAGYMLPQQDPVRPIDPRAWVMHTQAVGTLPLQPPTNGVNDALNQSGNYLPYVGALSTVASTVTTNSSSVKSSSAVETQNQCNKTFVNRIEDSLGRPLLSNQDPSVIVQAMCQPDSGLPVRDRLWLKITIYNAFIGSDLVDWLYNHVQGFTDRKDARKYATGLLKTGHIKHTVNKNTFSEQCYYVFNELQSAMSCLNLDSELDSVSVVAGQQQNKAACLLQQDPGRKESPVMSSGFQSGCSNKWSGFNAPDMMPTAAPGYHQTVMYPATNNNYTVQPFYTDNSIQSQALVKQHLNINPSLSTNLKSSRPPGSVHSGSGSSASGSSSNNMTRNLSSLYHNQQPLSTNVLPLSDFNQHSCSHNVAPPSAYQPTVTHNPINSQSIITGESITTNQLSLVMQNENSSSGFFSDSADKCD